MCCVSRPLLVVVSGLPGTGKSALAAALGERIGAITLSRDLARQQTGTRLTAVDRLFTRLSGRHRPGIQQQAERRLQTAADRRRGTRQGSGPSQPSGAHASAQVDVARTRRHYGMTERGSDG